MSARGILKTLPDKFKYEVLDNAAYLQGKLDSGDFAAASNLVDNTSPDMKALARAKFNSKSHVKVLT